MIRSPGERGTFAKTVFSADFIICFDDIQKTSKLFEIKIASVLELNKIGFRSQTFILMYGCRKELKIRIGKQM